jgi:hypothetical protein
MKVYIVNVSSNSFNAITEVEAYNEEEALKKAIKDFTEAKIIQYLPKDIKAYSKVILKHPVCANCCEI